MYQKEKIKKSDALFKEIAKTAQNITYKLHLTTLIIIITCYTLLHNFFFNLYNSTMKMTKFKGQSNIYAPENKGKITTRFKWTGVHPWGISEGTKFLSTTSFTTLYLHIKLINTRL